MLPPALPTSHMAPRRQFTSAHIGIVQPSGTCPQSDFGDPIVHPISHAHSCSTTASSPWVEVNPQRSRCLLSKPVISLLLSWQCLRLSAAPGEGCAAQMGRQQPPHFTKNIEMFWPRRHSEDKNLETKDHHIPALQSEGRWYQQCRDVQGTGDLKGTSGS